MRKLWLVCICLCLMACEPESAKDAWNAVVKNCATTDLSGATIQYFGPSNNVGPGSIWRPGPEGGYRLRYNLGDMPGEKTFITRGEAYKCDGSRATFFGLKAAAGLTSPLTPTSAELSNDFKKAKSIEVQVQAMAWDLIREGPFESYVKTLPVGSGSIRDDLDRGDRLVLYRALRISGYAAQLKFSASDAASLKAKYSGPLPKALTGDVGAELSANWTDETTLKLSSSNDFFIAGELVPYAATGFAATGSAFGKPVQASAGPLEYEKP